MFVNLTLKKKLTKQIQKSQPSEKAKPKEFIAKQKNPVKLEKLDGDKAMKPQEKPKPVDKKTRRRQCSTTEASESQAW